MKKRFLCFCLCLYCIGLWAANTSFKKTGNDLLFLLPQGNVKLEFCTDDMFRVRHSQGTVFAENEQWMVRKYDFTPVHYTCLLYTSQIPQQSPPIFPNLHIKCENR